MLEPKTPRFRLFKAALPIQLNPQHLLLWVFVGFWFAQAGYIFRVRVPYFEFIALSLIFQKCWVYGKRISKSI